MKKLGKVILHSSIDVITNSSTELFCEVTGEKKLIESVLDGIQKELGCTAVDFSVDEAEDDETEEIIPNQYNIFYCYEIAHEPCKFMMSKIKEKLNVIG